MTLSLKTSHGYVDIRCKWINTIQWMTLKDLLNFNKTDATRSFAIIQSNKEFNNQPKMAWMAEWLRSIASDHKQHWLMFPLFTSCVEVSRHLAMVQQGFR